MSAALLLTGLSWLSIKPKPLNPVALDGGQVSFVSPELPAAATAELQWVWQSLAANSETRGMVVFWKGSCVFHEGVSAVGSNPSALATDV